MTHCTPALATVLLLGAALTANAQSFLPGEYRLAGTYANGTQTAVALRIRPGSNGELEVRRRAERNGQRWELRGSAVPSDARKLTVAFELPVSGGISGALSGSAGALHKFRGTYTLDADGQVLSETLTNLTRIAPEDGWQSLDTSGAREQRGLTYGELAKATIPPLFEALIGELGAFTPTTLPHEAKALRKRIGKLRLHLDLFAFAYPGAPGFDPFLEIRESLDEGYESMGHFKDLYDEQGVADPSLAVYDSQEVVDRIQPVLAWQSRFGGSTLALTRYYLNHPKKNRLTSRRTKDLSPFFWGIGIEPERDLDGIENLARLQRHLLEAARDELPKVARIKDDELIDKDEQEAFHDFRKALRSTVKIAELFPAVFTRDASAEVLFVDGVVGRFGDLNDALVAHAHALKRGQSSRADRLEREVEDDWDALKKWLDDEGVDRKIRDLRRLVRH